MQKALAKLEQAADLLRTISHPARLCMLQRLLQEGSCNVGYMQDCMGLPQSTISTHLQKLRSAGIVTSSRHGLEVVYTLHDDTVKQIIPILLMMNGGNEDE